MNQFPIMLFAAGLGTRMGELTANRPKPLIKVAGKTLLDHALTLTNIPQIGRKVVNVHYKADMIRDHLVGQDIQFSDERGVLLETGGGLRNAIPLLGNDTVVTTNTDAVWRGQNPIEQVIHDWDPDHMDCLLLLCPKQSAFGHQGTGDFVLDAGGKLTRGADLIYTGVQIVKIDDLSQMPDGPFSLNLYWDHILKNGRLFGSVYTGQWCDVGRPEGIKTAENMLANDV